MMLSADAARWRAWWLAVVGRGYPAARWRGLNSLPLPGTQGSGPGSYDPGADARCQQPATELAGAGRRRDRRQCDENPAPGLACVGHHALNGDVDLPANATAKIGQTSLLGSQHIELAPPKDAPPQGKLREGSLIPLSYSDAYPTTEQTLAACRWCSTAVDSANYRTSPRRSAPRSGAARKICEA